MSKTGVSKLWPMGQFYRQPVFVTKVLLEQNHTCLCPVYGCFCVTMAVLNGDADLVAHKA